MEQPSYDYELPGTDEDVWRFSATVAVQLEAVRAGAATPRDEEKAEAGVESPPSVFADTA